MRVIKPTYRKIDYSLQYRKWHSDTQEHIQNMKDLYRDMLYNFLPLNKEIRILDVGCGMGFTLMSLQDMGYVNAEGIDIDSKQIEECIKKHVNAIYVEDSMKFLLENHECFDLIIALDIIEHIAHENQLDFLYAIHTALKSNGELICTVPNANSSIANRWYYNDWTHHKSFTEHSLEFLLLNAGFLQIQVYEIEFFHPPDLPTIFSFKGLKERLLNVVSSEKFRKDWMHWQLFKLVRSWRRIQMIAELGWDQGLAVPLSLNLLTTASKN
jgi:2-polyprenyl-3-methyl-5-hydroxy-6-metoxy-1,4-benzoquinol methylase